MEYKEHLSVTKHDGSSENSWHSYNLADIVIQKCLEP